MNGGTSDASTSTDDVKDRPLCLFYFTHPFGVLSPEPPTVRGAPVGVTRAFLNMEPMEPFHWGGGGGAPPPGSGGEGPGSLQYELGARVHASPLSVVGVTRARRASSPLSSLFAGELWPPGGGPRRPPYARMLPPLRLPSPRDLADATGSDDVWPARCLNRFSLPPIELPRPSALTGCEEGPGGAEGAGSARSLAAGPRAARCAGGGVRKARWRRERDVRRVLARLLRRAVTEGACCRTERGASPALQRVLATIRDAWASPASLRQRCRVLSHMIARDSGSASHRAADSARDSRSRSSVASVASTTSVASTASAARAMPLSPRADASPGLLCRRYSVPETIMRKYRLEQQSSDSEEGGGGRSPRDTPRSAGESPRHLRRDRELMRKSALLRRMWARPAPAPAPAPAQPLCRCQQVRSLDASRDELRSLSPASGSESAAAASPDPQARLDSSPLPASPPSTAKATAASTELASSLERPPSPPYEVLEVVVSESAGSSPPAAPPPPRPASSGELSLDEYVSRVLVESLHSLSDRLEGAAAAAAGGVRRLSVVEKEIKVRLQNAAVNTIVHLSPTSNHQIIFGNEELYDEAGAAPGPSPPPARPEPPPPAFDAVIQHEHVNRAVLQQIQKLFREEMHPEASEPRLGAETSPPASPVAGLGAGNYLPPRAGLVPRRSAVPHSASMEVHASSSEDAEALGSDATSLVDSLDDPDSPRSALRPRVTSGRGTSPAAPPSAAFFVRIRDDAAPDARVAECLPERIRRKLHRRQRKRELRMECARRGKVRALRDELERRRAELQERELRRRERAAAALADALLEDAVAALARDECRRALDERPAPRALPRARPPPRPAPDRAPRRIYQKSEIREGDKCIEILEILEYSGASRSSPESTPTEESGERARGRRSRIPVPVPDAGHMRLTGGNSRAAPPLTELLLRALATPAARPAPPPPPRERSNSLRFKRVFDMIPEERGGPSPAEEAESPPPAPAPPSPPRRVATRSAGTSPGAARRVRSQSTMTSPSGRSAATSPRRAPPRPPPPPPREGSRERCDGGREPERRAGPAGSGSGESGRSSSSERSGGSLLCSLAPRWLAAHARQRRRPRRAPPPPAAPAPAPPGGWSVTVAGSCRAALPHDVEMRLRFPHDRREAPPASAPSASHQECACAACAAPPSPAGPALPPARPPSRHDRLTLTMKNEESAMVTRDGVGGGGEGGGGARKVSGRDALPELDAFRASRTKLKSSVKTRRGYSLHCWLPDDERAPIRANNGLSVLGCAIIPELKPRVPTMSERDLTRVYTPRHYLRS